MLEALHSFLKTSPMMAYLAMMSPRLVELHRVLKPTGSLYLHCDATASHYLRMLLDGIFGKENFRNEIIWKRRSGHSSGVKTSNKFGSTTDSLLFYGKSDENYFKQIYSLEKAEDYIKERFIYHDGDGRLYRRSPLNNPADRPNLKYEYNGYSPPPNGWAVSREVMEQMEKEGRLYFPADKTQRIQRKMFLDEYKGQPIQNLWTDIPFVNPVAKERLGYPTQKPQALLERIIEVSCPANGVVFDPFCGCGTTVHAAQKLKRQWIGIDVTYLAINLIKERLNDAFPHGSVEFEERGQPTDFASAKALAELDKWQFQQWALSLIRARPLKEGAGKGADRGVDGFLAFYDHPAAAEKLSGKKMAIPRRKILVQVKGGHTDRGDVAKLLGDVNNQKFAAGVLITLEKPTKPMRIEAADAGSYKVHVRENGEAIEASFPKIQILSVEKLMDGTEHLKAPPRINLFAKAEIEDVSGKQTHLI